MSQVITKDLYGVVFKVTPGGQAGIVKLDKPYPFLSKNYAFAVLNNLTINLPQYIKKHSSGYLVEGKEIKIISFSPGPDGLQVLKVQL